MAELIQARYTEMWRGFQFDVVIGVKFKSDLLKVRIADKSAHFIKTWVNFDSAPLVEVTANPYVKYVDFKHMSGEMVYAAPEWKGKVIKYTDVKNFIDNYRAQFPSYHHTLKYNNIH